MNIQQMKILLLRETDLQGAIHRCCDNEEIYLKCLKEFMVDETIVKLNKAVNDKEWDDAFTSAHALKGLAGNMGFVPLMHSSGQLVTLIRGGRISDVDNFMSDVNSKYRDIMDAISEIFKINV